jgi:hypothetical protein
MLQKMLSPSYLFCIYIYGYDLPLSRWTFKSKKFKGPWPFKIEKNGPWHLPFKIELD